MHGSTLELYREALRLRRELQGAEELTWAEGINGGDVLAFERPGGWLTVANLGAEGTPLPAGELLEAATSVRAQIDEQVGASEEVGAVVRALEQQYDAYLVGSRRSLLAEMGGSLPTADELGDELEKFLADQQDG